MAQLVEQRIRNAWVAGSSPAIGSLLSQESGQPRADSFLFPSGGISSVGRALASQAEGRGFESRNPLFKNTEKRCEKRKVNEKVKKVFEKFARFENK